MNPKAFNYYRHKQDRTFLVRVNGFNVVEGFFFSAPEPGLKAAWVPRVGLSENFSENFVKVGIRDLPSCARNASHSSTV